MDNLPAVPYTRKDVIFMTNGQKLLDVHTRDQCATQFCVIHHPSNHHMKTWDYYWDNRSRMMMRMCEHSVLHPDPDQVAFERRYLEPAVLATVIDHYCDGCCTPPKELNYESTMVE